MLPNLSTITNSKSHLEYLFYLSRPYGKVVAMLQSDSQHAGA